jgi:hypothetical protein
MGRGLGDEEMTLHRSPSFSDWVTPQGSPSNSGATNEVGPLPLPVGGCEAPADAMVFAGPTGSPATGCKFHISFLAMLVAEMRKK